MKFQISKLKFKISKTFIAVIILIIIAAGLRFYAIGKVPPSPDWDEVALGYNSYSILHTGKDEYGKLLPVVLRSFDDYKPALYTYLIIPIIPIFGLTLAAVRLPSVIFGVITIVAAFYLSEELLNNKKLSFLIAFLLAISPWHIQFSRIAFESNVGLSFNILAALFFIKGLRKKYFIFISSLFFAASIYVYQSEKVFVPIFIALLVFVYWNDLRKISMKLILSTVIFFILLLLPMAFYLLTNTNSFARAKGVSVFSDNVVTEQSAKRIITDQQNHDKLGLLIDNRRILFGREVIANYLSHFDLKWLFITGDINRHHPPFMGLMYLWELPFLFIGLYSFVFSRQKKSSKLLILGWFLIAAVPASVTTGVPHAVRTLNFLPTFQIFVAFGVLTLFKRIENFKLKYLFYALLITFATFNFVYYLDQYFVQLNYYNSKDFQYGYSQATTYIKNHPEFTKVIVSNKEPLDQSYMFFLFYLKYNPELYQSQTLGASGGFAENHSFGRFEFRPIDWRKEMKNSSTIFIGSPKDFPDGVTVLNKVNYLDGTPDILIIKG